MKAKLKYIYTFFPVQLFLLHFKKYQVLLLLWYVLGSTINSDFLKHFGADALFFVPEYLGSVNFLSALITGLAWGIYIMSWNITTFILHSKRFKFLAATGNPFLKYCINNAIFPILFMLFYFIKLYQFDEYRELMSGTDIFMLILGVMVGIIFILLISFAYFFGAEKTINRNMSAIISNPELFNKTFRRRTYIADEFGLKVSYYLTGTLSLRKVRAVGHYRQDFLDTVFKRHHIAAILCMLLAFVFLIVVGFFLELQFFAVPAAASILIFFAVMVAFIGSLSYFLQSWSLPVTILLLIGINFLYRHNMIDARNKAYGLSYLQENRPSYNRESLQALCNPLQIEADKKNMLAILDKWKARQGEEKPVMILINVSGGGLRSAAFVMNAMQQLDSLTQGKLMPHTMLISGASGGMLAATYYRELYRYRLHDSTMNLSYKKFGDYISSDLLNPVFTSMIARDIFAPMQKFSVGNNRYIKDRGYAFEKKLSDNTHGLLNIQLKDVAGDEQMANVPMIIFSSVIADDGRKLLISTQPISFMMKPRYYAADTTVLPDAVDFGAMFKRQHPMDLRVLTAMRMNATFPYVLPNVWLPSNPVIDVMDAGLRDNVGTEASLRFADYFREWLTENTGGVVLLQLRHKVNEDWDQSTPGENLTDRIVTPATMLQHNWFALQQYQQMDQFGYFNTAADTLLKKITILYQPKDADKSAAINFHLTERERRDVLSSFYNEGNKEEIDALLKLLR